MTRVLTAAIVLLAAQSSRGDKLILVAGGGQREGTEAVKAKLTQPFGVDFGADGQIYIVEMAKGERLLSVTATGELRTRAGTGATGFTGNSGAALKATFNGMHSLAVGPGERVYLADTWNNCVRVYDEKQGTITAFAGTGKKGFSGDGGPAEKALFGGCYCVAFDPDRKNLFITDLDNRRIRKVEMGTRIVTTVAGSGKKGVPVDGESALEQPLVDPRAACADRDGNLWILERGGHALRVVDRKGKIRTVAGTGKAGMGAGQPLRSAMNGPKHLCIDQDGSVLIADTENHRIIRFDPRKNALTVVAGTGKKGAAGSGGDPLKADFNQPHGVAVHPKTGDLYISDANNGRVLRLVRD